MIANNPVPRLVILLIAVCTICAVALGDDAPTFSPSSGTQPNVRVMPDGVDAVVRRTDSCGSNLQCGAMPANAAPIELISLRIGRWAPLNAFADPYEGIFLATGGFLRIDLLFEGLVHPPGPLVNGYTPRLYGDNPVFGFIELDVDTNGDTGGNMDAPLIRYTGNVGRFGGVPVNSHMTNRVSTTGRDPDVFLATHPWIERSGADFELELRGDDIVAITHVAGDFDGVFESGESWDIRGRFFRRAQGYNLCAGGPYEPLVWLRFAHCDSGFSAQPCLLPTGLSADSDATSVTFVYPLTNPAYALANSTGFEPMDAYDFNANSVLEALVGLNNAAIAQLCNTAAEASVFINDWSLQDPYEFLDPYRWRATALLGTARAVTMAGEGDYIWTDVYPNIVPGDFNGDGLRTNRDAQAAQSYVALRDGNAQWDSDGSFNGEVAILNFGTWFSLYDVDYDGFVGAIDTAYSLQAPGDYDNDGDVDLADFHAYQVCLARSVSASVTSVACEDAFDATNDGAVGLDDYPDFESRLTGP